MATVSDEQEPRVARVEVATHVEAPPERVWEVVTDWEHLGAWMGDVRSVTVTSPRRGGRDVHLRVRTAIAFGIVIRDEIVVTHWEPPLELGVLHHGPLFTAVGAYEFEPTPHGTHVTWWDDVQVPLGDIGDAAFSVLVVPWLRRQFRASLAALKRRCEGRAQPRPGA